MRLRIYIAFAVFVELYSLKELLDFLVLPRFLDQVRHRDLAGIEEHVFDKILNFLVPDFIRDGEYLEAGTAGTKHHELQLNMLEVVNLVKVKHVEQD